MLSRTDLKARFPTDVAVDFSDDFVQSGSVLLQDTQVFIQQRHGVLCLNVQALEQGVPLVQQELDHGTDVRFNLLLDSPFVDLWNRVSTDWHKGLDDDKWCAFNNTAFLVNVCPNICKRTLQDDSWDSKMDCTLLFKFNQIKLVRLKTSRVYKFESNTPQTCTSNTASKKLKSSIPYHSFIFV